MKLVVYNLNDNGTVPNYIVDGGYLAVANNKSAPQDFDLIGIAVDSASQIGFVNENELLTYAQTNNLILKNPITNENLPIEPIILSIWNKQFEIADVEE